MDDVVLTGNSLRLPARVTDPCAVAAAVRAVADDGFGRLGLPRIGLDVDVTDVPAIHVALAAGFALDGVARAAGSDAEDLARFARLATDDGRPIPPAFPPLPPDGLGDGVLALRRTTPADAGWLFETAHDPVSLSWGFTDRPPVFAEFARGARRAGLDWLTGRIAQMTIVDVATGRHAGDLALRSSGPPQVGEFGYSVHPAFRGRGYTTRALRLAVAWAFDCGFVHLRLGAKVGNVASRRAAEAAGFRCVRIAPMMLRNPDGTFSDEAQYELTVNPPR